MVTSAHPLTGKEQCPVDTSLVPDEVKSLITVIKGQVFLLGKDWDNLLEPEKKELALSAVKSVSELNDLVRGAPDGPDLRVIG
jgi:hypothetical protein